MGPESRERMAKILSVLFVFSAAECCRPVRDDMCSSGHVRRVFLRLGESGGLGAYNVGPSSAVGVGLVEECKAEIVTCPSCVVSLAFRYINLSCHCESRSSPFLYNPCRSDYVRVTEPPHDAASGVSFCGTHTGSGVLPRRLQYKSKTRTVRVSLFYSKTHAHAFTMDYTSEPNRQLFIGASDHRRGTNLTGGSISSPFFPAPYPKDLLVDYLFLCKRHPLPSSPADPTLQDDLNCRIHLVFTDFHLASPSSMEFYEGTHLVATFPGTSFRLPIITSSTNSLTARFFASGGSSIGFKAFFSFIPKNVAEKAVAPVTDCGGFVGNSGGAITMMNMVESQRKKFYCVWLIRPGRSSLSVKTHLYLKVVAFLNFERDAHLEIRQGLTSEAPLLEDLRYYPGPRNFQEHVIPIDSSYHLSLRASFGPSSRFAISYAEFSLTGSPGCLASSEFLCRNLRCISRKLTCDGFDHCGDNSDESEPCNPALEGGVRRNGRGWPALTANYYFPKVKQLSGWTVLLVSLLAVTLLASALTAVYLITTKARMEGDLQDRLQAISDLRDSFSDQVSVENIVIDDPPSYEPPPSYEEVAQTSRN